MNRMLRQLAQGLGVLWGSVTLVFLIFSQVPDPARAIAGQNERTEAIEAFRELHGLNLSLGQRYVRFLGELSPLGPTATGGGGPPSNAAPPSAPTPAAATRNAGP